MVDKIVANLERRMYALHKYSTYIMIWYIIQHIIRYKVWHELWCRPDLQLEGRRSIDESPAPQRGKGRICAYLLCAHRFLREKKNESRHTNVSEVVVTRIGGEGKKRMCAHQLLGGSRDKDWGRGKKENVRTPASRRQS